MVSSSMRLDRDLERALASLHHVLDGDVRYDDTCRLLYAADASLYQQRPIAVAYPRSTRDCVELARFAGEFNCSLIPRGGGTSLAGQVVGAGVVVDFSRYMNGIRDIDVGNRFITVQPGAVLEKVNEFARSYGLMFAPDPSTANRCDVGGIIGNNAWGAHCPLYGTTRDNVEALTAVLIDGSVIRCEALSKEQLDGKLALTTQEGHVYRTVVKEVEQHLREITEKFPPLERVPCNSGYALHAMASRRPWVNVDSPPFSLVPLICGSEGTLSLITEATLELVPLPKAKALVAAHFNTLQEALCAVPAARAAGAGAVELLDHNILNLTKSNLEQRRHTHWVSGEPKAVLLVEFSGDSTTVVREQAADAIDTLRDQGLGFHFPILLGDALQQPWAVRRAGLGLLMGMAGSRKPVTFIEDSAVAVEKLPDFVGRVEALMRERSIRCVYYGSVSMGLIHLRPLLNLKSAGDRQLLSEIAGQVSILLAEFGGTMSAKHGDGRVRGPFIRPMFGDRLYGAMKTIKHAFDPRGLLNPGKIFDVRDIDEDLRHVPSHIVERASYTAMDWEVEGGFIRAVERCNGAAVCRRTRGGTMCPSFQAGREEGLSTRGRANVFRQVISERGVMLGLSDERVHQVLDECLSCKGCRSECPANVDMARLKAEHLQHYYDRWGLPVRGHFLLQVERLNRLAARFPAAGNWLVQRKFLKKAIGIHSLRSLPRLASEPFSRQFKRCSSRNRQRGKQERVVLLNDIFAEFYEVDVGLAAVEVLTRAGQEVALSPCFASTRIAISQGQLRLAKRRLVAAVQWLYPFALAGVKIVGLEPSEVFVFRDEAISLADTATLRDKVRTVTTSMLLFEEWILDYARHNPELSQQTMGDALISVHGHCHQKALLGTDITVDALARITGANVSAIPSGCCGMAGAFGYEKEHYTLSQRIGELVLFPTIRALPRSTIVIASGGSCRAQIRDGVGREVLHPAQVIRESFRRAQG